MLSHRVIFANMNSAVLQIIVLILSATLHEVAHGYVAYALGDPTAKYAGRLTLNPLVHLELVGSFLLPLGLYILSGGAFVFGWAKPVPYNPYNLKAGKWGPSIVAVAGPLTNLLLALVFGLIVRLGITNLSEPFIAVAILIVYLNCLLAIFNLIPIPPLDGSKILFTLIPTKVVAIEEFFGKYQFAVLILFIFFGWRIVAVPTTIIFRLITGIAI